MLLIKIVFVNGNYCWQCGPSHDVSGNYWKTDQNVELYDNHFLITYNLCEER